MLLFGLNWKYINEGNVHIVLELLHTDYVLRLIKEDGKPIEIDNVRASVDFVNRIMSPLLLNDEINRQEMIIIPKLELSNLSLELYALRPENRRHKSTISPYAIKTPNLCIISSKFTMNYCIEIKPKEGYLAKSLNKYDKCYFCLKQYLKLEKKEISVKSKYCPLKLFSGDKGKMKHALTSLIECPQNNLKLFENGMLIYGEGFNKIIFEDIVKDKMNFGSSEMFVDFIIDILLMDVYNSNKSLSRTHYKNSSYTFKNTILGRLIEIQKLTEDIEINVANIIEKNFEYLPKILEELEMKNLNLKTYEDRDLFLKTTEPLHLALISVVAKDCSIMISFSPNINKNYSLIQVGNRTLSYKVSLTDLEPKSVSTLNKRLVTERHIIQAYEKYIAEGRNEECKYGERHLTVS